MSNQYYIDINYAAKSDPYFDKTNSIEIGDLHGVDPKVVLKDIKELRGTYVNRSNVPR